MRFAAAAAHGLCADGHRGVCVQRALFGGKQINFGNSVTFSHHKCALSRPWQTRLERRLGGFPPTLPLLPLKCADTICFCWAGLAATGSLMCRPSGYGATVSTPCCGCGCKPTCIALAQHWRRERPHAVLSSLVVTRVQVTTHVLKCIDKVGGLDNYLASTSDKKIDSKLGSYLKEQVIEQRRRLEAGGEPLPPPRMATPLVRNMNAKK